MLDNKHEVRLVSIEMTLEQAQEIQWFNKIDFGWGVEGLGCSVCYGVEFQAYCDKLIAQKPRYRPSVGHRTYCWLGNAINSALQPQS